MTTVLLPVAGEIAVTQAQAARGDGDFYDGYRVFNRGAAEVLSGNGLRARMTLLASFVNRYANSAYSGA